MFALLGLPIDVAYHLVSALAGAFTPLLGGLAVAAAIVLFTIMVRLLVLPLSYYAFRGQRAQARIAPQIQELYKRHSGQPERLQRELSALRAREGAGMFTGCLPALLQIPFFTVVYRLFLSGTVGGSPNLLLHQHLFSASLGSHWLTGAALWSGQGLVFAVMFALLALVAWLSTRAARRGAAPGIRPAAGGARPTARGARPAAPPAAGCRRVPATDPAVRDGGLRRTGAACRWPVPADHDRVGGGRTGAVQPAGPGATSAHRAEAATITKTLRRAPEPRVCSLFPRRSPCTSRPFRTSAHRPGGRRAHRVRGAPAVREDPPDPVGELRLRGGARGVRDGADQQVLRGLPGPPLLRGPAGHRPDRDAGRGAGAGAVRRRARQRPAVFGLARQPRRLPGVPAAGRHRDGDGAADGRPPDARLAGVGDGQVVPVRAVRGAGRHRAGRPRRGARPGAPGAAEDHLLRRDGDPRGRSTSRPSPRSRPRWTPCWWPTSRTSPGSSPAVPIPRRWVTPP